MSGKADEALTIRLGGVGVSGATSGEHLVITLKRGVIRSVTEVSATTESIGQLDYRDCFLIPLLIDVHAHVGPGLSKYGVERTEPELAFLLSQGDAGPENIDRFVKGSPKGTRFAISVASKGEAATGPCYDHPQHLDSEGVERCFERHRELLWGISANLAKAARGTVSADVIWQTSLELAEKLGVPLILGTGETSETDVAAHVNDLRAGDILTYLFRPGEFDLFSNPLVARAVGEAQSRGVVLDASHGESTFDFDTAERAVALGVVPDTLSSDLSTFCTSPVRVSLGRVVGKAIAVGVDQERAISGVTKRAAEAINVDPLPVQLEVGTAARFAVGRWSPPGFVRDHRGRERPGRWIDVVEVFRDGAIGRKGW